MVIRGDISCVFNWEGKVTIEEYGFILGMVKMGYLLNIVREERGRIDLIFSILIIRCFF